MSADPSVEENFSAIDVRCLSCGLPSPPLTPRIGHHPHPPHQQHQQAGKGVSQQIRRISRVCMSGIWREGGEAGLGCRQSNGPSLEPRGFGKPSPTYPAPPSPHLQYTSYCPYNPLPTSNIPKWLLKGSGIFREHRGSQNFAALFFLLYDFQDSLTLAVCFYEVLRGSFL